MSVQKVLCERLLLLKFIYRINWGLEMIFDLLVTLIFIQFMICVVIHVTCFHVFPKSFKEAGRMCWLPWVLRNLKNIEKEDKKFPL
jgi:hypothetical protein